MCLMGLAMVNGYIASEAVREVYFNTASVRTGLQVIELRLEEQEAELKQLRASQEQMQAELAASTRLLSSAASVDGLFADSAR